MRSKNAGQINLESIKKNSWLDDKISSELYPYISKILVNHNCNTLQIGSTGNTGYFTEAKAAYKAAREAGLADAFTYNAFITAAGNTGYFTEAKDAYNAARKAGLADVVTYASFITVAGNTGNFNAAQAAYDVAVDAKLADAVTYGNFINVLMQMGNVEAALKMFQEHYQTVPNNFHGIGFGEAYIASFLLIEQAIKNKQDKITINVGKGSHNRNGVHVVKKALLLLIKKYDKDTLVFEEECINSRSVTIRIINPKKYSRAIALKFDPKIDSIPILQPNFDALAASIKPAMTGITSGLVATKKAQNIKTPQHYSAVSWLKQKEGNCLFDAVTEELVRVNPTIFNNMDHVSLRRIAVEHIQRDEELQAEINHAVVQDEPLLRTPSGDIFYNDANEYLRIMEQDRTWGTYIELEALRRELNLRIIIHTINANGTRTRMEFGTNGANITTIELDYINGNHYMPHTTGVIEPEALTAAGEAEDCELFELLKKLCATIKIPEEKGGEIALTSIVPNQENITTEAKVLQIKLPVKKSWADIVSG